MSDTPRTDEWKLKNKCATWPEVGINPFDFARQLERELNAANERIKRLEEAGDAMDPHGDADCDCIPGDIVLCKHCHSASLNWQKAKQPIS
jgi:hypothetical protein